MNETSSGSDLKARLQKQTEQERKQIEAVTRSELKKLADNLRQSVEDEMYIIVRDIKDHTRRMNAALWGGVAAERGDRGVPLSRHLGRELGPDAVVLQPDPKPHRDEGLVRVRDPRGEPDPRAARSDHVGVNLVEVNGQRFAILPESTPEIRSGSWTDGLPSGYRASEGDL